jgi:hypothetical protein
MSEETVGHGTDEITALLADRQRLQGWLDRLARSSGSAPEAVRQRVWADYQQRLAEVVARLGGFTAALSESLEAVRSQQADLEALRTEAEEALAEAELRHAVGEYTDQDWEVLARDHGARIDGLSADISRLADEAARLAEVLGQVAPQYADEPPRDGLAADEPGGGASRAPGDDLEVEVIEVEEVSLTSHATVDEEFPVYRDHESGPPESARHVPVEAPRFTPKPGLEARPRERPTPRTLRFPAPPPPAEPAGTQVDEMTFLKSVTLDTPGTKDRGEARGVRTARSGGTAAKTLKCAECGAMNRPTEWYCERCGAELAAV